MPGQNQQQTDEANHSLSALEIAQSTEVLELLNSTDPGDQGGTYVERGQVKRKAATKTFLKKAVDAATSAVIPQQKSLPDGPVEIKPLTEEQLTKVAQCYTGGDRDKAQQIHTTMESLQALMFEPQASSVMGAVSQVKPNEKKIKLKGNNADNPAKEKWLRFATQCWQDRQIPTEAKWWFATLALGQCEQSNEVFFNQLKSDQNFMWLQNLIESRDYKYCKPAFFNDNAASEGKETPPTWQPKERIKKMLLDHPCALPVTVVVTGDWCTQDNLPARYKKASPNGVTITPHGGSSATYAFNKPKKGPLAQFQDIAQAMAAYRIQALINGVKNSNDKNTVRGKEKIETLTALLNDTPYTKAKLAPFIPQLGTIQLSTIEPSWAKQYFLEEILSLGFTSVGYDDKHYRLNDSGEVEEYTPEPEPELATATEEAESTSTQNNADPSPQDGAPNSNMSRKAAVAVAAGTGTVAAAVAYRANPNSLESPVGSTNLSAPSNNSSETEIPVTRTIVTAPQSDISTPPQDLINSTLHAFPLEYRRNLDYFCDDQGAFNQTSGSFSNYVPQNGTATNPSTPLTSDTSNTQRTLIDHSLQPLPSEYTELPLHDSCYDHGAFDQRSWLSSDFVSQPGGTATTPSTLLTSYTSNTQRTLIAHNYLCDIFSNPNYKAFLWKNLDTGNIFGVRSINDNKLQFKIKLATGDEFSWLVSQADSKGPFLGFPTQGVDTPTQSVLSLTGSSNDQRITISNPVGTQQMPFPFSFNAEALNAFKNAALNPEVRDFSYIIEGSRRFNANTFNIIVTWPFGNKFVNSISKTGLHTPNRALTNLERPAALKIERPHVSEDRDLALTSHQPLGYDLPREQNIDHRASGVDLSDAQSKGFFECFCHFVAPFAEYLKDTAVRIVSDPHTVSLLMLSASSKLAANLSGNLPSQGMLPGTELYGTCPVNPPFGNTCPLSSS